MEPLATSYSITDLRSAIDTVVGTTIALLDQVIPTAPAPLALAYRRERIDLLYVAAELCQVLGIDRPAAS